MRIEDALAGRSAEIQATLDTVLDGLPGSVVTDGMRHALSGGKRLRGFLVIEGGALFDAPVSRTLRAAAAVECLHAYSLVHDDLPCMDDDDLRRGQPTVNVTWDEATAVLVGDALQTLAFELLAAPETHEDGSVRSELVLSLAQASGASGMVLGQAQDIAAESAGRALMLEEITELQANKTGALIRWAAEAGAFLGQADRGPLRSYATALGLAFQIADDILDETGDEAAAGKRLHKDAEAGKATFVSLLGLEAARQKARDLVGEADTALDTYGARADRLRDLARYVIARDR